MRTHATKELGALYSTCPWRMSTFTWRSIYTTVYLGARFDLQDAERLTPLDLFSDDACETEKVLFGYRGYAHVEDARWAHVEDARFGYRGYAHVEDARWAF